MIICYNQAIVLGGDHLIKKIHHQWSLNRLLILQAVAAIIIIIIGFPADRMRVRVLAVGVLLDLALAIGMLAFNRSARLKQVNGYLQSFVFPLGLTLAWFSLCKLIFSFGPSKGTSLLITCLFFIYLGMFVPVAIKYARTIHNSWLRGMLLIVWLIEIVLTDFTRGVPVSPLFKNVVSSGFLGAVSLAITMMIAMRQWNIKGPQLKPYWTENTRWLTMVVVLMMIPMLLLLGTNNWSPTIYRNSTWLLFLTSLEAGIAEEFTFRYGLFSMIYTGMHRFKNGLVLAVFLTSLIFGCMHLFNLGKQPLLTTLSQVIAAVFIGVIFQIIYLYTGQLWITVATHFFFDWTGFVAAQTTTETWSTPAGVVYTQLIVLTFFIIALLLWSQFGKRHLVMVEHADYLITPALKE